MKKERKFIVYKHTSPDGKIYIGMTSQPTLEERSGKNGKGYSQNQFFWEEIKKFGWENFTHEILEENLTEDQACDMEREMIKFYQSNNPEFGYNIRKGGDKPYHFQKHTDGTRARISESLKGRPAWNSGKTGVYSDETRRKMGEKNIGKPSWNLGIPCADTTRYKISESKIGRHWYNNGDTELQAFECPDGFTKGRLKRA